MTMRHSQRALALLVSLSPIAACVETPTPTTTPEGYTCEGDLCTVTGPLLSDTTFTADKRWLLKGGVFIGDDADPSRSPATLTIEPGTKIFGDTAALSFLLVTRGSKIVADGTEDAPIVFTSAKDPGQRARGDWGGLVINGQAPVNGCSGDPCTLLGEAGTGTYGGADPNDDSGILRFVRVEFAGALIDDENELNAYGFQGVGSGTVIENIQAHMVGDDCVEFFGGTANARRVVCTGIADDNLDWTFGWTGKLQFMVAQQYADAGGNGIEADNNEANHELTPVSHPTISNVTLIGVPGSANSKVGVLLRRGTEADLSNIVVKGFNDRCFDMDDEATFASAAAGRTSIRNSIFDCTELTKDDEGDAFVLSTWLVENGTGNTQGDPALLAPSSTTTPDFRPSAGGLAASGGDTPSDSFFQPASFRGGIGTDESGDWTKGWTEFAQN